MRQRVHNRRVNGEYRVEEVGQPDSLGLGDETEDVAVPIKGPRKPTLNHFEAGFVVPVEEASTDGPGGWRLVGEFDLLSRRTT